MNDGTVFDIQRFSVNDGPGIRTTVFMKGCPLSCRWCHNPEGLSTACQVRFFQGKCIGCKKCVSFTGENPDRRSGLIAMDCDYEAEKHCPGGADTVTGKHYTKEELLNIILKDKIFYKDGGGVTFSGGEPTLQAGFLNEMIPLAHENGIHVTLDTSGLCETNRFMSVATKADLVLYDIKGVSSDKHKYFTGVNNDLIKRNFEMLLDAGASVWVRVVMLKEYTADINEILKVKTFLDPYRERIKKLTLMPYHAFGNSKYPTVGQEAEVFTPPSDGEMEEFIKLFRADGYYVAK